MWLPCSLVSVDPSGSQEGLVAFCFVVGNFSGILTLGFLRKMYFYVLRTETGMRIARGRLRGSIEGRKL